MSRLAGRAHRLAVEGERAVDRARVLVQVRPLDRACADLVAELLQRVHL